MPDLFTDEYETAKAKWERARETYLEATRLFEAIHILLKHQHREFEEATRAFQIQQSLVVTTTKKFSSTHIKSIRKETK